MEERKIVKVGLWRESFSVSDEDFRYFSELKHEKVDEAKKEVLETRS